MVFRTLDCDREQDSGDNSNIPSEIKEDIQLVNEVNKERHLQRDNIRECMDRADRYQPRMEILPNNGSQNYEEISKRWTRKFILFKCPPSFVYLPSPSVTFLPGQRWS